MQGPGSGAQKTDFVIRTKIRIPPLRQDLVVRPRLLERFLKGIQGPLTLIAAPAGFGKTSLAVTGVTTSGMKVAWLSLDEGDNDSSRWLKYLTAALHNADPALELEAVELLESAQSVPTNVVMASIVNDLEAATEGLVLVLDDYQCITSPTVHDAVAFLLNRSPQSLHLVITTRSDPPLPLARLRARRQLEELRAADLRFTPLETTQFLNDLMGLGLSEDLVAALEERTEGWIAGLQMVAVRLATPTAFAEGSSVSAASVGSGQGDATEFIRRFSGSHRHIVDYLLEEVLARQPEEVQRFLLCTSILKRLCAPLCAAVLATSVNPTAAAQGCEQEHAGEAHASAMLDYLERNNLFLLPLDDERRWYRYHHLFADLLQIRLRQAHPALVVRLHSAAATWLEREGFPVEAVDQALAAGDHDRAARLVESNTTALLARGELSALMGWIAALPAKIRNQRPWLCLHQAYALAFAGRLSEAGSLLDQAEAICATASSGEVAQQAGGLLTAVDMQAIKGSIAAVRAMLTVMGGRNATAAVALASRARDLLPADHAWDRSAAAWALGIAERDLGHLDAAQAAFAEQVSLARSMGNIWTLVTGLTDLGMVLRTKGQLRAARALFEEALQEAVRQGARGRGYIARMEAGLAGVLYEQNELAAARSLLDVAITHTRQWPNPNHLAYAFVLLARVQRAQGNPNAAQTAIWEAVELARTGPLTRVLRRMIEADRVRFCRAQPVRGSDPAVNDRLAGQADVLIRQWLAEIGAAPGSLDECGDLAALALARVSLAGEQTGAALDLLRRVLAGAPAGGRFAAAIESLILTALALATPSAQAGSSDPRPGAALDALGQALELAEPGGYVRLFLDEGRPLQLLLAQWLAHAGSQQRRGYAARLLAAFDAEAGRAETLEPLPPDQDLIDPLSQRELEVLHLLAQGLPNQAIAQQLIVAPGTIKAHTASIYRKLDVANRTQAVARARQLQLIP